jgi:hypothetical protein
MKYDIIGDIHGHANKLEGLLLKLGYTCEDGVYHKEGHRLVFLGDLIDGGTQNHRVLHIVRNTVKNGLGVAVMGNHEYNAICYHSRIPGTDKYLRAHTPGRHKQHRTFLEEFPFGSDDAMETIEWFKTLPLFLDLGGFRAIHACWSKDSIDRIKPYLHDDNTIKSNSIVEFVTSADPFNASVEILLKGKEVELPPGISYHDKYGTERYHIRAKWWGEKEKTFREIAFGYSDKIVIQLPDDKYPAETDIPHYNDSKPVFFGHYWCTGTPTTQTSNICCVDYSAGRGGPLTSYRFSASGHEGTLDDTNFKWH